MELPLRNTFEPLEKPNVLHSSLCRTTLYFNTNQTNSLRSTIKHTMKIIFLLLTIIILAFAIGTAQTAPISAAASLPAYPQARTTPVNITERISKIPPPPSPALPEPFKTTKRSSHMYVAKRSAPKVTWIVVVIGICAGLACLALLYAICCGIR